MSGFVRYCWSLIPILLTILATSASAGEGLDIQSWKSRPGVKLVAVDFFADWCAPCKAALPKWDALLAKYHERGLRLIIVTVNSKGRCLNFKPGAQKPDAVICDQEGEIAQAWGAENLPQGFLFDWHGTKLAEHADVDQVAREVEAYFRAEPVVAVEDPKDDAERPLPDGLAIKRAVNAALKGQGKLFSIVADERERARLKAVRAKLANDPSFSETAACQLGEALPPNSWLTVTLSGKGANKRLGLELFSLTKGCLAGSAFVPVGTDGVEAAAQEAVYALGQSVGKGEAVPKAHTAVFASGCKKDTDCKGERICVKGECAEPPQQTTAIEPRTSPVTKLENAPRSQTGKAGIQWVYSQPAKLEFAKSETTVEQYASCVQEGKCTLPVEGGKCNWGRSRNGQHPINCVSWYQAAGFCEWIGGRLPTAEEWSAEASNNETRIYPWGDDKISCRYAIWGDGTTLVGCGKGETWPVCSKPNGNSVSGLCDMSGNVWEWTSTLVMRDDTMRVIKGGSWYDDDSIFLLPSNKLTRKPDNKFDYYGFRCVRESR